MPQHTNSGAGVEVLGRSGPRYDEVLTADALSFLATLERTHRTTRDELLEARVERQHRIAAGATLRFRPDTAHIRQAAWQVAAPAPGLEARYAEITGPTDAKMAINALNSGAQVWLADFEDANAPTWDNLVGGQLNLKDALDARLQYDGPDGKQYRLRPWSELATIVARPRGWHLTEKHLLVDGARMSASLFDFGLYFFHCAQRQLAAGKGPYFYLPKLESHLEARLWNDVFLQAQEILGIARGTIRATVLVETVPAAFEMEEILYELREHSAGLNAGRWDYLFSMIKVFRTSGDAFLLPDRNSVAMTAPMMRAYTNLLVQTCHRRGAHAIGGMAAFIPSRRDSLVNERALAKVRDDKEREAGDGFDGSWVAHPDLVQLCRDVFAGALGGAPDQRAKQRSDVRVTADQLLDVRSTPGEFTEEGLRTNVSVALQYLAAWLRGAGAVGIFNLMEDAATAEICRSQIWQWVHNGVKLNNGERVTYDLVQQIVSEELAKLGDDGSYATARASFEDVALADDFIDFLTLALYEKLPD
jgi:malate synthase